MNVIRDEASLNGNIYVLAEKLNVPFHLGEFGALPSASEVDRFKTDRVLA